MSFVGKVEVMILVYLKKFSSFLSFNYQHRRQGYQEIAAYHSNSYTPKNKPKNRKLTELKKEYNKALAKERMIIEHINRKLKILKILSCK